MIVGKGGYVPAEARSVADISPVRVRNSDWNCCLALSWVNSGALRRF